MATDTNLPSECDPLLDELANVPDNVRTMWRYAMVLLMIDDEKARVTGSFEDEGKTMLRVRTVSGDEFLVVKPEMSEETEQSLLEQIRQIVSEDSDADGTFQ